jgi:hypothetical protein
MDLHHRMSDYEHRLQYEIEKLWQNDSPVPSEPCNLDGSDTVFLIRPLKNLMFKYISMRAVQYIATEYIGYRMGETTDNSGLRRTHQIYQYLLWQPQTRKSASWIFAARIHSAFQRGGRFEATHLGGSNAMTVELGAKPYRTYAKVSDLGSQLRKQRICPNINSDVIGVYFRPQECNLHSLHSFLITNSPTTNKPVLVIFEVAVSVSHPVEAHGLLRIWAEMPPNFKQTPPILVFVVPADVARQFPRQSITLSDSHDSCVADEWDQYVIPVSSKSLWGCATHECEESAIEPAVSSVPENHVLRPRSSSPLRATSFLRSKRKASPAQADNEAEEACDDDEDAPPQDGKVTKARKLAKPASRRSTRAKYDTAGRTGVELEAGGDVKLRNRGGCE